MAPTDINHLAGLALLKRKLDWWYTFWSSAKHMQKSVIVSLTYSFFFFYLRRKEMNKTKSYLVINFLNLREREILFKNKTTKMKLQNSSTRLKRCFGSRYQMSPTRKALPSESTAPHWTRAAHRTFNYQTVHIYSDKNISPSETDGIQLLY